MRNIYAYKVLGSLVAITRREIIATSERQIHQAYIHLIKLLCIKDDNVKNHWVKEISEMLDRVSHYVYKGRTVDYKTLEKMIKNSVDKKIHDRVYKKVLQAYCKHSHNRKQTVTIFCIDSSELLDTIVTFLKEQAQNISDDVYDKSSVKSILLKLQKQYADRETKTLSIEDIK